ncbi:MAG: hypothetical protein V1897_07160 [Pseudomonadota bacterium]
MSRTSISTKQCLIIERHDWETGGHEQQLQIPLEVANCFFGPGTSSRSITVRVFLPSRAAPPYEKSVSISRKYRNSSTRRINGFPEIGDLGPCFIFFEETTQPGVYDVWCQRDTTIVAAKFPGWCQARTSQYGRGRLAIIVRAPVPRPIDRI